MIKNIINDWDGTLLDSMEAILQTYAELSGKPIDYVRKVFDPDWRILIKILGIPQITDVQWRNAYGKFDVKLFPGAREYLQRLERNGYNISLVTSSDKLTVEADLEKHKLSDIFDVVITGDDVKELKPNPQCLKKAVKELETSVSECVSIGDIDADATAAKCIGMKFIGVSWGYHPTEVIKRVNNDEIANDFDELYNMIKKK